MRFLWLARGLPFPLVAGDRIYSRGLAGALAEVGADVAFAGLAAAAEPEPAAGVTWHVVPGGEHSRFRSLLSRLPLVAARHATASYRREITRLLNSGTWDAVIVDHYGMAWALDAIPAGAAIRVFVAHNHEAGVAASQWRDRTRPRFVRLYLWQNWLKTLRIERYAARHSDVVTTITSSDARQFARYAPGACVVELTPGYKGVRLASRTITSSTPRSVVMFGSYRWSAKQASLQILLDKADPILAAAGITLDVVGDMEDSFRTMLAARYRATRFHGYVSDPTAYLRNARMALVGEAVGGGFKLKLLEYLFQRVPIAALAECASGLPNGIAAELMLAPDIDSLLQRVIAEIDHVDALDARQTRAFLLAADAFNWSDRGRVLIQAIRSAQDNRQQPSGLAGARAGSERRHDRTASHAALGPQAS